MTNSIGDMLQARAFLIIGSNTTEQHPIIGLQIKRAVRRNGAKLILADPRKIELAQFATIHLQHEGGTDIPLLNGLAYVILDENLQDDEFIATRTENFEAWRKVVEQYPPDEVSKITGVPVDDIVAAARMYATNKPAAILYAMGITQHIVGHYNVTALANLAMLTGNVGVPGGGVNPLRGQNNVQGACDVGCLPNVYPGYQKVTDEEVRAKFANFHSNEQPPAKVGLTVIEMMNAMLEGKVRAMYIMGENPALSDPDSNHVRRCLEACEFLVVNEIFLSETAQMADVVLPAAASVEKDGTYTNTERRIQLAHKALDPPGQAKPDWQILCELAKRMGAPEDEWSYSHPSEIMEEIAAVSPIYGGIRYERLEPVGLQWPCWAPEHGGTPILHVGRFTRGLGYFTPVHHQPADELPDDEYPFMLTTGRLLQHWHTGTMTRRVGGLDYLVPEELVEINPIDAEKLGIEDGDWIRVSSRRGEVVARAHVFDRPRPGLVFMTFHFAEALGNVLTNAALDPIAKIPEYKVCAVKVEKLDSPPE